MHKSELEQLEEDHKKALTTLQEEKEEQLAAFSVKEQKLEARSSHYARSM